MKIAIVTGASSGMGREFVIQMSEKLSYLDEIWVIARRRERLLELSKQINIKTRIFDINLCNRDEKELLIAALSNIKPKVCMLVNCAGFGYLSDFMDADKEKWSQMINLNCVALTELTHEVVPFMPSNARIINLASSAAFLPQAGFAVYAAGKSYVLSFSRALNKELQPRNISVTAVCPGPVDTEFFETADPGNNMMFIKKLFIAKPDKVVALALKDAHYRKEMSVYGPGMKIFLVLTKVLPHGLIFKFIP